MYMFMEIQEEFGSFQIDLALQMETYNQPKSPL
jgi:hypothetical protein